MITFEDVAPEALQQTVKELVNQDRNDFPEKKQKKSREKDLPFLLGLRLPQKGDFGQDIICKAIASKLALRQAVCYVHDSSFPATENIDFWFEKFMQDKPILLVLHFAPKVKWEIYEHFYSILKNHAYISHTGKSISLPPLVVVGCWEEETSYNTFVEMYPDWVKSFSLSELPRSVIEREIKKECPYLCKDTTALSTLCDLVSSPAQVDQLTTHLTFYTLLHQIEDLEDDTMDFLTDFLESFTKTQCGLLPEELLVLKTIGDKKTVWDLSLTSSQNDECIVAAICALMTSGFIHFGEDETPNPTKDSALSLQTLQKRTFELTSIGKYWLDTEFPRTNLLNGWRKL